MSQAVDPAQLLEQMVDGYRVLRFLGSGAAGYVYEAVKAHQRVALKVYKDWLFDLSADVQQQRIINETRLRGTVHHHLCSIYGTGSFERDGRTIRYLLMQLIEGDSLEDQIRVHGAVPYHDFKRIARELLSGTRELHNHGVVHRDIKPANVMIERSSGRSVLTDFGVISDLMGASELTDSHDFLGTLRYAAPEWVFRDPADAASKPPIDVFALGATFLEMATGQKPYPDIANRGKLVLAIRNYPHQIQVPGYPLGIVGLLQLMLAKEPALRPSIDECEEMLGSDGVATVAGQAGGDITPPELLNFSIAPQAVDNRAGAADFEVTVEVRDDLSGLASVHVDIRSPKGQQAKGGFINFDGRTMPEFNWSSQHRWWTVISGTDPVPPLGCATRALSAVAC